MSGYENVVGGKLKLKGKALDVKAGGLKKKKKKQKSISENQISQLGKELSSGEEQSGTMVAVTDGNKQQQEEEEYNGNSSNRGSYLDTMTPAEKKYMEQRLAIEAHKLAKTADKSHRDRIEDFNQYLANMSEHYDIPKVGPG